MSNLDHTQLGVQLGALLAGAIRDKQRDIFAGQAMAAMLAHDGDSDFRFIAEASYRMAAFMMAERARQDEAKP